MRKRFMIPILLLILGIYGVIKISLDSRMAQRRLTTDVRYLPSPQAASALAIGYKLALADLTWIEALNYFGGELANKNRSYKYMNSYLQIILKLDPLFRMFYEWAATVFVYNGLPITQEGIIEATRYINEGIRTLAARGVYDDNIIAKGAFNFGLEAHDYLGSLPYFELTARASRARRDFLLIGSTYARQGGREDLSTQLKLEFLAFTTFEAQNTDQLKYAIQILTSRQFDAEAASYMRAFRLQMEKDEQLKEMVKKRFESTPLLQVEAFEAEDFRADQRIENLMRVDIERNWLPADLHLLLSL